MGNNSFKNILVRLAKLRREIKETWEQLANFPKIVIPTFSVAQLREGYEVVSKYKAENKFTLEKMFGFKRKPTEESKEAHDESTSVFDRFAFEESELDQNEG